MVGASNDAYLFICKGMHEILTHHNRFNSIYMFVLEVLSTLSVSTITIKIDMKLEIDYQSDLSMYQKRFQGMLLNWEHKHIVFYNDEVIGSYLDLIHLVKFKYAFQYELPSNMKKQIDESLVETEKLVLSLGHACVYLSFSTQTTNQTTDNKKNATSTQYGKVIIELYDDICPKACENFIRLCRGDEMKNGVNLKYLHSVVHRIIPNGWISCGDIIDGSGIHSISVFPDQDVFEDESFSIQFTHPKGGILGYASNAPHTNGSQFFITTAACDWLSYKMVGFGRVVVGMDVLHAVEQVPLLREKPLSPVFISACGVIKT